MGQPPRVVKNISIDKIVGERGQASNDTHSTIAVLASSALTTRIASSVV